METRWLARVETFHPHPISGLMVFLLLDGPLAGQRPDFPVTQSEGAICDLIMGDQWTSPVGWRCVLEFTPIASPGHVAWALVRIWNLAETRSLLPIAPSDGLRSADEPLGPDVRTTEDALRHINRHRDRHALRRLDPVAAGWTAEDVCCEARYLGWKAG